MKWGAGASIALMLMAVVFIIWFRFDQYVVKGNFMILSTAVCDPTYQECFAADCDPSDEECDATPYQKVMVRANEAPACLKEHACETFSCDGLESCSVEICSSESLEEGEVCAQPPVPEPEYEATDDTQEETEILESDVSPREDTLNLN